MALRLAGIDIGGMIKGFVGKWAARDFLTFVEGLWLSTEKQAWQVVFDEIFLMRHLLSKVKGIFKCGSPAH